MLYDEKTDRAQDEWIKHPWTFELRIDDLFVGMEVVSEVKLGYCSPFQLEKESLVLSTNIHGWGRHCTPPELELERASCSEINTT